MIRPFLRSLANSASLAPMSSYSATGWHTARPRHKAQHLAGKPRPGDTEDDSVPIRLRAGFSWQVPGGELFVPFSAVIGRRYSVDSMERMRLGLRAFEDTNRRHPAADFPLPGGAELVTETNAILAGESETVLAAPDTGSSR